MIFLQRLRQLAESINPTLKIKLEQITLGCESLDALILQGGRGCFPAHFAAASPYASWRLSANGLKLSYDGVHILSFSTTVLCVLSKRHRNFDKFCRAHRALSDTRNFDSNIVLILDQKLGCAVGNWWWVTLKVSGCPVRPRPSLM